MDDLADAFRRAGVGLRESSSRFEAARRAQLIDHSANAVVEAAMWVVALDDLRERLSGDRDNYRKVRNSDDNGRVVRGLKWVRNQGVHQITIQHQWSSEPGFNLPFNLPLNAEWHIRWGNIPEKWRPGKADQLYEGYVECLQGRWVSDSLHAAARWLDVDLI